MNFQSLLSLLRPPANRASLKRDGLHLQAGAGRGQLEVVIARSLLRVKVLPLAPGLGASDRWSALRAQSLAWQPFEQPAFRFGIQKDRGVVFAWDAAALDQALRVARVEAAEIRVTPETALLAPPPADELLLRHGVDGYEAQSWRDGVLAASRWWPDLPAPQEWQEFCRSASAPDDMHRPEPAPTTLLDAPWLPLRSPSDGGEQMQRAERLLIGGVGLVLIAASVQPLHEQIALRSQIAALEVRILQRREEAGPAVQAKDRAKLLQQRAEKLAADIDGVQPLVVLQHLAEVLPKDGVILKEFDLEGLRLKLVFELGSGVSRGRLVEQLQSGGWFAEVSEQQPLPQPGWVAYGVRLAGVAPQPAAAKAGAGS